MTLRRPSLFCALVAVMLLVQTGCGGGTFRGTTSTPGIPGASLSVTALSFAAQTLNTTSATQTVTLTNTGTATLSVSGASIGGTNASSFAVSSACGASLAAGTSCTVSVAFTPAVTGTLAATLTITDNAANATQTVTLSGTGTAAPTPAVSLSASSLSFNTPVNTAQPLGQSVTVTNTGNASLSLTGITIAGTNASAFAQSNTCGSALSAGSTCSIVVTFTPAATGSYAATLMIADNASNSPQAVALTGKGTAALAPAVTLSVSALTFTQAVGAPSTAQSVTLTNTGNAPLTLSGMTLTGAGAASFAQTNTCGSTLAAGANCVLSVTFSPVAAGSYSASVSIADNAANSPQSVALAGTGTAPAVTLSATALTFTQVAASTSAAQVVTLTNSGSAPLAVSGITLTGTNAASFAQTNTCGATLAAGANCVISVTFTPATAGPFTAGLAIADNASGSPQTVMLAGTGTAPAVPNLSLSPAALSFTQAAESTSAAQTVTLSNTGTGDATLTGITLGGANPLAYATTNTCGTTLAAGANCTISVTFTPSLASALTASLQVASNATVNPTAGLTGMGTGTLTINTASATDWKITNGAITLDYNSTNGHVFAVHLAGDTTNLVDTTSSNAGLYMDDTGQGTGTQTSTFVQNGNAYIDWSLKVASSSTNPFTYTQHFVITANDPGFHVYSTVAHSATDIAGSIGQWQYVFRIGLGLFTETYEVNSGLGNLGVIDVPQPDPSVSGTTDPGRQVQNAAVDLHGLSLPSGFTREFYTKYDYSSQEYLHKEHGVYGSKYGAWLVLPKTESLVGGPTKQDLVFTDNIIIMEALSSHLDNSLAYTPPQGVATNRFFGPYYFHFNTFTATNTTPASLYNEAQTYAPEFDYLYDIESTMIGAGYTPSTGRGTVAPAIAGAGASTPLAAWTVLSDNATNFQYSSSGAQYWVNQPVSGTTTTALTGVIPGTYRLSSYVLGQWGELRQDNVVVTANTTTPVTGTFTPENFGTSQPIFTIGTPDRSGHEFLHGHDASGNDLRNYWGAYNYWADFAANKGAQVYYATAVGTTPATNDLNQINYNQWKNFDPPLYAGIYNGSDDTTDGYNYIVPSYVGTPSTAVSPGLQIHFTTNGSQLAQGQFATLSVGVACAEASAVITLNGHQLIWHYSNASDCMIRSGLSGYYQWFVMQFPVADLNAAGADNVILVTSSQSEGFMLDAMRLEITNTTADPAVTGWHDYEYIYGSTDTPASDKVPSN